MQDALIIALGIGVSGLLGYYIESFERRRRQQTLQNRNLAPLKRIYDLSYFGHAMPFEFFEENWLIIGEILHVEPGRLRPTDTLTSLLGCPAWLNTIGYSDVGDMMDVVKACLEDASADHSSNREIKTLDDILKALWEGGSSLAALDA